MYNVRRTRDYYSREAQLLDILARDYDSAGYYGDGLLKEAGIFDSIASRFRGLGSRVGAAQGAPAAAMGRAPAAQFNPNVGMAPLRRNNAMSVQTIPEGSEAITRKMQAFNPSPTSQAQTVRMPAFSPSPASQAQTMRMQSMPAQQVNLQKLQDRVPTEMIPRRGLFGFGA